MTLPTADPHRWARFAALFGLLCLHAPDRALGQADTKEIFTEDLTVTERTVYVDDSVLPTLESAFRRSRSDFLVRIDGAAAELVDSAAEDPPRVAHLVWLDRDLASRDSLAAAANQLATALVTFPEQESFSIVEAGPEAPPFQQNVSRTEMVLRLRRLATDSPSKLDAAPTLARRIAALNRLAVEVSRYRSGDLGALWLVAEPWAVEPSAFEGILRAGAEDVPVHSALGALQRTARVLASFGWVIFPVSARSSPSPAAMRTPSRDDPAGAFLQRGPSPREDRPAGFLQLLLSGGRGRRVGTKESRNLARSLDLATEFRLTPMAILARATSGALAGDAFRIAQLAEQLRNRRPLVVRDWTTVGAALRRLDVVWLGGDGRALPALPWAASQTPPELGVSRLLSIVDSLRPQAGSPLRLRPSNTAGAIGRELCFAYPRERGAFRMLWWRSAEGRVEIGRPIGGKESPAPTDDSCAPLPEGVLETDVVQLEALDSLEWGAARLSTLPVRSP
jgi:hypothetical protein